MPTQDCVLHYNGGKLAESRLAEGVGHRGRHSTLVNC